MTLDAANLKKLEALKNPRVIKLVEEAIALAKPAKVTVITDSEEDIAYVRQLSLKQGEEAPLAIDGHTIHFDGIRDQARDKAHTMYLLDEKVDFGFDTRWTDRDKGLKEILGFFDGSMANKEMLVRFFSLGPVNSKFALRAMQITDSAYVAHSEDLLYRQGYEEFKRTAGDEDFFYFLHSAGELDERGNTLNVDNRRIYIDLKANRVFTVNNQYAGNSLGLKKLAFRLAIQRAHNEGWLAEHMFLMGAKGPNGRTTYFSGAFPSACGKTSTAMLPGQTIVGDDIAYLKPVDNKLMGVNVERGIFGIIENVNAEDDPVIFETLHSPGEVIFSNVLNSDKRPYWLGMGVDYPEAGVNFQGEWKKGMTDDAGNPVKVSHKNARYTISIKALSNKDVNYDNPEGVNVQGFIYGGRDSDTSVPVAESLSWAHGVMVGATVESETTAATLGAQGVRVHCPYANLDFIALPLAKYVSDHLDMGEKLDTPPTTFATNYFLKVDGNFLNGKLDKRAWLLWAEGRIHGDFEAIKTPVGFIPKYEDLEMLFKRELGKGYTKEDYDQQFSLRIDKYLAKAARMKEAFGGINMPEAFTTELDSQIARLEEAKKAFGPVALPEVFV